MTELLKTLHNGVKMPVIGFGTWQLKDTTCYNSVVKAIETGFQLIDTAAFYNNEEYVGDAIKTALAEFNGKNQQLEFESAAFKNVFVTTKVKPPDYGFENTYNAVLTSLNKLKMEQIDLVLLHWPGSVNYPNGSEMNAKERLESWKALEKLYKEKKIRAIGVSNYYPHHLDQLMKDGAEIVPMVDQVEMHPFLQLPELEKWAKKNLMALQAYSSLGVGSGELLEHPTVKKIAANHNYTCGQVLLRFGLEKGYMILPRSSKLERVVENYGVHQVKLTAEEMDDLCKLDQGKHFCWNPDTYTIPKF